MIDLGIPPEQERSFALIGLALLNAQHTESMIEFTLKYPLIGADGITLDTLKKAEGELYKKTLGQFLKILRERVDLDPAFDKTLSKFLEARNLLAHHLDAIPGWNLATEDGRKVAATFLGEFIATATFISNVLTGLSRAWADQIGVKSAIPVGSEAFFAEIDALYKPGSRAIFFPKKSETS